MSQSSDSKLFHTVSPQTEKAHPPNFVLVLTMTADLVVDMRVFLAVRLSKRNKVPKVYVRQVSILLGKTLLVMLYPYQLLPSTKWHYKNNTNNRSSTADHEGSLFQCTSVLLQRFNSVLLNDSLFLFTAQI